MPDRDIKLLTEVRDIIVADPTRWRQDAWARQTPCGTTGCVAGLTVLLRGGTWDWSKSWKPLFESDPEAMVTEWVILDGEQESICSTATEMLGLSHTEADILFEGDNSYNTVINLLADLIDGEDIVDEDDCDDSCTCSYDV